MTRPAIQPHPAAKTLTTTNHGDKDSVPDNSDEKILHVELGTPT